MKVSELIKILQQLPQDRIVIVQKDAEGNGFSPLAGADGENCAYLAETTWYGEVGLERLTEEAEEAGYSDEDIADGGEPCVVLYPIN